MEIREIQERIQQAAVRAGRKGEDIRIMAVTKLQPWEAVREAYNAGIRIFGENRVQEAREKYRDPLPGMELHLIGHLQTNKVKYIPSLFPWVDSIDRLSIAEELERRFAAHNSRLNVLLEVNTSGEPSKTGYASCEELLRDLEQILSFPHLKIRGLMTVGPLTGDRDAVRKSFRTLSQCFEDLKKRYPEGMWDILSMGMSSDFEIAVEEGSTLVRLGTLLFGERVKQ